MTTTFKFGPQRKQAGSNAVTIDVTDNGRPVGQLWTFKNTATTKHPWHAKMLNGKYHNFYPEEGGLRAAKHFAIKNG